MVLPVNTLFAEKLVVFRALSDTTPMTAAELDKASIHSGAHNMLSRLKKWAQAGIVSEAGKVRSPKGQIVRQYVRAMTEEDFVERHYALLRHRPQSHRNKCPECGADLPTKEGAVLMAARGEKSPGGTRIRAFTLGEMARAQIGESK